ncbi:GntR family transcriptional regulator [Micromonospora sp. CA-263727]|uniref:GntR family transcriptional regulator n=1 Tax=Micromonospora sp. CA-263727 TaxID=3239967 RepID=UPI003D8E7F1C
MSRHKPGESTTLPGLFGRLALRASRSGEIAGDLRNQIQSGRYQPGDRLPRLADLMTIYETRSRSALDRALRELVAEGLLTVVHGSGIYVRSRQVVRRDLIAGLRMEYEAARQGASMQAGLFEAITGADAKVEVSYDVAFASERVARLLDIDLNHRLLVRSFRYVVDGTPHQVARSYMPAETAARIGLKSPDDERPGLGTLAHLINGGIAVDRASLAFESRVPTAAEVSDLAIPGGTSVFEHWRVLYRACEPVEVSTAVVPGDRVAYEIDVKLSGDAR